MKPKSQRMFPKNIRTLVCSNSDSTTFLFLLFGTTIKESSFSHLHHRHTHWHPKSKWRGNWSLCILHLQISSHDQQKYTWFSCTLWWATQLSHYNVWLRAGRPSDRDSIPGRGERIFPLASVSRPALEPTQSPVQWVPGVLSLGLKRGWDMTLTTHPILVQRSRISRSYTSSPPKRLHGV
jgi:hypothetical protein